ncbi:MAG: hypothetical protein P1U87_10260 [Verrucomicrobiales bacterium]|nr:hypothetical protein [Verrucomicrobiales bacterium]
MAHADPIDIGNRLELFADDYLISEMGEGVTRKVHQPEPKGVVLTADAGWEGNTSGYYTVFRDNDLVKMIYRGWAHQPDKIVKELHREFTCYAESKDGLTFTKPELGLHEWEGSKANNIILDDNSTHNFAAFKDANPDCPPEALYKGIGGEKKVGGLFVYQSPDGIHWKKIKEEAVITDGAFDSQNIAFWDNHAKLYRAYYRIFSEGGTEGGEWKPKGVRAIRTSTSKDYVNWEPGTNVTYPKGTPHQHLYTNAVQPYLRAPHLLVGFPTRYLPDEGQRVEPIFMMSRDGVHFRRYNDPVVPESAPSDRAGNRSNYMVWGMVELPSEPGKLSVYATEAYYGPVPGRVRRFVYRADGFVSLRGSEKGGRVVTNPFQAGKGSLVLNYTVRKGGSLLVERLNEKGEVLAKSKPLKGDSIAAPVEWANGTPFQEGGARKLRFTLRNADLYSMKYE